MLKGRRKWFILLIILFLFFIFLLDLFVLFQKTSSILYADEQVLEIAKLSTLPTMEEELERMKQMQLTTFNYKLYNTQEVKRLKGKITLGNSRVNHLLKSELAFQYLCSGQTDSCIIMIDSLNSGSFINCFYMVLFHKAVNFFRDEKSYF